MDQTSRVFTDVPSTQVTLAENQSTVMRSVHVALLDVPLNPMRHTIDDEQLQELMDDIRHKGLLQNLGVVPIFDGQRIAIASPSQLSLSEHEARGGRYRVAYGHRRLLALQRIHMAEAMCKVFCDLLMPETSIMYSENEKRESTTDIDLAVMYAAWAQEPGMTEKELCRRAGKGPQFIYDRIELLNGWPQVADALKKRQIQYAVARALNRENDEPYMLHFLAMAVDGGLSSRVVAAMIQEHEAHKNMAMTSAPAPAPAISVIAPQTQKVECAVCGDNQSYNLVTMWVCREDAARLAAIRNAQDTARAEGDAQEPQG